MVEWSQIVEDGYVTASEIRQYITENGLQATKAAVASSSATLSSRARSIIGGGVASPQAALMRIIGLSAGAAATLVAFAENPVRFFTDIIAERLLIPFGQAVFFGLNEALTVIALLIYGGNFEIGLGGGYIGILDIPFLISGPVSSVIFTVFSQFATLLIEVNTSVAQPLTQIGIAAPAATGVFWFAEISVIVYTGWLVLRTVDIPLIKPTAMFLTLTKPVRNIIDRWFR